MDSHSCLNTGRFCAIDVVSRYPTQHSLTVPLLTPKMKFKVSNWTEHLQPGDRAAALDFLYLNIEFLSRCVENNLSRGVLT